MKWSGFLLPVICCVGLTMSAASPLWAQAAQAPGKGGHAGIQRDAGWPHWRGPHRDDTTAEPSGYTGGNWLAGTPRWQTRIGGTGETTPVLAGGRLYTLRYRAGKDYVVCLDATRGAKLWEQSYACPGHGRYAMGDQDLYVEGPLAAPEYDADTGYLYTLSCDGDLNCWDTARQGNRRWGFNLYERFGAKQRPFTGGKTRDYGYVTAPFVYGNWLIVQVGASRGNLMAFDKRTGGKPVGTPEWCSENVDAAGHTGGMVPMQIEGIPCVAVMTVEGLLVVRLDPGHEGKTAATYRYRPHCASNIVTPAVWKNLVILSTHLAPGNDLVEVTLGGAKKRQLAPHSEVGTPVYHAGRAYKASGRLECWELTAETSRLVWSGDDFGFEGNLILTSDNRLIVFGAGKLALYSLAGEKLSEKTVGSSGWQHLLFSNGCFYWKDHQGQVVCYPIRTR